MSDKILKFRLYDNASLASLGTLTTPTIDLRSVKNVQSIRMKATSATAQGSVDLSISMATSDYIAATGLSSLPVEDFDAFNTSILDHWNTTPNPTDWQIIAMPAPLAPFIKLQFAGLGSNPADTIITAKLIVQESF